MFRQRIPEAGEIRIRNAGKFCSWNPEFWSLETRIFLFYFNYYFALQVRYMHKIKQIKYITLLINKILAYARQFK